MSTVAAYLRLKAPAPKMVSLAEMEGVLRTEDFPAITEAISRGFVAYSKGKVSVPSIQTLGQPPLAPWLAAQDDEQNVGSQMCIKSGYIDGDEHIVTKIAPGGIITNAKLGLPTNSGLMLVFSQRTARLEAILFDEGLLTEIRTAACGALAAKLFAPKNVTCIGVLGSGTQARWQLRMLAGVTTCRDVSLFALERLEEFKAEMEGEGWRVNICSGAEEVVQRANLLVTVTTTRRPIVKAAWLKGRKNMHVTCIGADSPGKGEMEPEAVACADFLCCDALVQTFERGEFQHARQAGLIKESDVKELGHAIEDGACHRQGPADDRLTIFDTSGVAVQDVMITKYVFEALAQRTSRL